MKNLNKLKSILKDMGSCLVAYSGGADSSFLLKVAHDALGEKVLAVTADSPTYTAQELGLAKKMAQAMGVRHKIIKTYEFKDKKFILNPVNRCYYCKHELFSRLKKIALVGKLNFIVEASNISDKKDFRPGSIAKEELGVRSPLQEAGISKEEVRFLSRKLGLKTWDKPSLACLASRIPFGSRISLSSIKQVDKAEDFLRKLGFKQVRVRHYGGLCRIEVYKNEIAKLLSKQDLVVERFKKLGYNYITLDLEGFRSGSMNLSPARRG